MKAQMNWSTAIQPLLKKYKGMQHPLQYANRYQLLVMVIISARTTDAVINKIAPDFFKEFPNMKQLAAAKQERLFIQLNKVRNFAHKTAWLMELAQEIKTDKNIPTTLEELTQLPGIGRKSANVIIREMGLPPEGIVVDLHVVRVAQRLGIVASKDPKKIETELMQLLPSKDWDVGMSFSFLGREICRPKPLCELCMMRKVCNYYHKWVEH